MTSEISRLRIRALNDLPVRRDGEFVVYWMIANRRLEWNFSLQQAVNYAERLGKPLVILEALRCGYQWASDRLHRFELQGMADNRKAALQTGARYIAYVEPEPGSGAGMLDALAKKACVVVTDDFPCFFLPRMLSAVARRLPARLEAVDSNGLLPLRATDKVFPTAYAFRRFLQKELPGHMLDLPEPEPLTDAKLPQLDRLPREDLMGRNMSEVQIGGQAAGGIVLRLISIAGVAFQAICQKRVESFKSGLRTTIKHCRLHFMVNRERR